MKLKLTAFTIIILISNNISFGANVTKLCPAREKEKKHIKSILTQEKLPSVLSDIILAYHITEAERKEEANKELDKALYDNDIKAAQEAIDKGANINHKVSGLGSLLIRTIRDPNSDIDVIYWLIENGADIDVYDSNGEDALIHAIKRDNPSIVLALLKAGADINRKYGLNNKTAIDISKERGGNKDTLGILRNQSIKSKSI